MSMILGISKFTKRLSTKKKLRQLTEEIWGSMSSSEREKFGKTALLNCIKRKRNMEEQIKTVGTRKNKILDDLVWINVNKLPVSPETKMPNFHFSPLENGSPSPVKSQ